MTTDEQMITRAIKLAQESFEAGDSPFGCVVAKGKKIIMETKNRMKLDDDITAHAEIRAIRQMQKKLGTSDLSDYTLYSNFEPCPMFFYDQGSKIPQSRFFINIQTYGWV